MGMRWGSVRPRAGAWIETQRPGAMDRLPLFAPARGRGLKQNEVEAGNVRRAFAPAQGRGLKP